MRILTRCLRGYQSKEATSYCSTELFFTENKAGRLRGRPRINLPHKLNDDLAKYTTLRITLKSNGDLEKLKELAQNREKWKELTGMIYRTTNAEKNVPE